MDASVASKLMKSQTLIGVVLKGTLAIAAQNGRIVHGLWTNTG